MVLDIVKYGDPVLETVCDPVPESRFGSPELRELVEDMFQTMYRARGVGLAAPQVGVPMRITVIDCARGDETREQHVLINPEILSEEGQQVGEEGCLSIPGFQEKVTRPATIRTRARTAEGEWFELEASDLLARAICHENDHLNGVLFLSHLSRLKRQIIKRKIRNMRKRGEWD